MTDVLQALRAAIDAEYSTARQQSEDFADQEIAQPAQILTRLPALRPYLEHFCEISRFSGLPVKVLLQLFQERRADYVQLARAAALASELQGAELQRHGAALRTETDRLEPIWQQHPGITAREAVKLLKKQTDEMLEGLDDEYRRENPDDPC